MLYEAWQRAAGSAERHIREYFQMANNGRPVFTGSRFETFGGGGAVAPDRITADDLTAVSMLSVHVPAQAAAGITGRFADDISELLARLPSNTDLHELSENEFEGLMGSNESPGAQLWDLLRQNGSSAGRWGVGETTASKIMARKRPRLIPIYDSVVRKAVHLRHSGEYWQTWRGALTGPEGVDLVASLRRVRAATGQHHLSLLRVLDIVLWQDNRGPGDVAETVADED